MARPASDDLFRVIHALDRTEKGYVKKFCSRHIADEGSEYLRLFDLVDTQEAYDEGAIKKALAGTPMAKRLPTVKNYLLQQILEAMRVYHASRNIEREVVELLTDADFLWEKALYDLARKKVAQAKELASTHDEYAFHLKAISWEKAYQHSLMEDPERAAGTGDALSIEQERVIEHLRTTIAYENLGHTVQDLFVRTSQGDQEARRQLLELGAHPLLTDPTRATTRLARLNLHLILANWHSVASNDVHEAFRHATALLHLVETDTELRQQRPTVALTALHCYLQNAIESGHFDAFESRADAMWADDGQRPTRHIDAKRFFRAWTTECMYALHSRRYERISEREAFIRQRYRDISASIPAQSRATNTFMMARIAAERQDPRSISYWLRYLYQEDERIRPDLHFAARILSMCIAVDEGDLKGLPASVRALARKLKTHGMVDPRTDAVLSLFRRLPDAITASKRRALFRDTERRLMGNPPTFAFDVVDASGIQHWLEHK